MAHSRSIIITILSLSALLAVLRFTARWAVDEITEPQPLEPTAGRLQLVLDEQDVGLVQPGERLEVPFTVANTGPERLVVRQAPAECCSHDALMAITLEPGQTGEITAVLLADELRGLGRKHVRFFTSDPTCPELWLTVRGAVIRPAGYGTPVERSVLVK